MRKTREILRHKWTLKLSHRAIARSLGISAGVVGTTVSRATRAGLDWAVVESLSDDELEQKLYGIPRSAVGGKRPKPDCAEIDRERRRPGVTLELLHQEYLQRHPDGYRYSQFCEHYRRWLKSRGLTMRHVHEAGGKMFVDYSGNGPSIVDPQTGEVRQVELFVAVLGASSYTYAEASLSQKSHDWIASHNRAVEYFGGVTKAVVCDQLKAGVTRSCHYEPGINRTYEEWARHCGTSIVPARPRKPRDKAKAEAAVLVVQRWIVAKLRNEQFFDLHTLNNRIAELLEQLNSRQMKHLGRSRLELYEALDKPHLRPLPQRRFVYATWKAAKVNIDYHVDIHGHYYSVPYPLVRQQVDARVTSTTVELFYKGRRIASHHRNDAKGRHTTKAEHMPKSHRSHLEWTPSRLISWGATIGPATSAMLEAILSDRPHPEMGYRSCLGILRLAKRYGDERLEHACKRGMAVRARSFRHIDTILKHGLDRQPLRESVEEEPGISHDNIRGPDYYN